MRVPVAVERAEARGRQRFIDGGVALNPGITPGDAHGVAGEKLRKAWIEQIGIARPAAVVDEAGDRRDAEPSKTVEALVVPGPVRFVGPVRGDRLPQDGVAQRPKPKRRDPVEIVDPIAMAGLQALVAEIVGDPRDRAFQSAPHLKRWLLTHHNETL